jgi:hypothetical protein
MVRHAVMPALILLALLPAVRGVEKLSIHPLWLDFDMENIKEPKERKISYYYSFFKAQFIEQAKQGLDMPRWFRAAIGKNKRASNINAVDEVPDSSWFTNRHHLRRMSIEALVRGPDRKETPDFGEGSVITRAKTEGVTLGLQIKDKHGVTYIIKFDDGKHAELQSGAEMVVTKILHAAGYNVPENYIAYFRPEHLKIGDKVMKGTAKPRPFEQKDLEDLLYSVAQMPDGSYRVLASKFLSGKPKGPFPQIGIRLDDPNDLIPHEHRRELRGLRVIASWLNHWDMKEDNALDMYVEEDGRKFLRHYLIDFGSSLGGGLSPWEYFHGRELAMDGANTMKEIFSLGFYETPDERKGDFISPAMGIFSNAEFDAEGWTPSFPVMAFENMTDEDALWGTRIILSFTEPELRAIIATAKYTNPADAEYLLKTLLARRQMIARHWLRKVNPLVEFSTELGEKGGVLRFKDLMVEHGLAGANSAEYVYEIRYKDRTMEKKSTRNPWIELSSSLPPAQNGTRKIEDPREDILEVTIQTVRAQTERDPVTVRLYNDRTQNRLRVIGVWRG